MRRRECVSKRITRSMNFCRHCPERCVWCIRGHTTDRIFLATYPAMMKVFESFDTGFFGLIIADESHRSLYKPLPIDLRLLRLYQLA